MAELRILPPAARYLKKLKDKKLKALYKEAIDAILENPSIGEEKAGDLKGVRGYDIYYNKTNYELAYTVEEHPGQESNEAGDEETENAETEIVAVIMAGTRENFYEQLKRYWI